MPLILQASNDICAATISRPMSTSLHQILITLRAYLERKGHVSTCLKIDVSACKADCGCSRALCSHCTVNTIASIRSTISGHLISRSITAFSAFDNDLPEAIVIVDQTGLPLGTC